jgi:hypothetical protein
MDPQEPVSMGKVTFMTLLMTLPVSQADELERMWKVTGYSLIKILSWPLSIGAEGDHEILSR